MAFECCPITPSTVHRILARISPLEDPLPQNLISKPLLQRHHFLGLTLDDAAEYVAWPSSSDTQSHVQHLLEGQTLPNLGDHLNVQYTADAEDFLAHVCISSDLRLVFLWEQHNGWQYHDLATMPFPPNSVDDFNHAYIIYSENDFLPEQDHGLRALDRDDDDSYWNSYGQQDDPVHLSVSKAPEDTNSEDAYWARYSTIQGSADSTIPSPLPPEKNLKSEVVNNITNLEQCPERVIVPPTEFQGHHVEPYNPLEPPSPEAISRRLQALSSEPITLSSPLIDEPDTDSETPSSHHADINAALPNLSDNSSTIPSIPADDDHYAFQLIMQDTIKNLYRLWGLSRQGRSAEQDKGVFIDAVQHALEGL